MSASDIFTAFQNGQGAALAVVVGFAVLSLAAIDFVWLRVLVVAVNQVIGRGSLQAIKRERAIFHSQLGAYMASLLVSNLLSSVSFIMNAAWIAQGGVTVGALCVSQAMLSEIADVAAAYFTGAIAVHSFNSLVLKFRLPLWFCFLVVLVGWAAAIVLAAFPAHTQTKLGPFYTVDGLTCGISPEYPLFETLIHLVPIFVASLVAAVFYSLVFLILRGTIAIRGGLKLNLDPESRRSTMHDSYEYPRFIAAIARSLLWHPVAYVVLMFPHLIICLLHASGFKVSEAWRVITAATSALLGLANVLIFYNTIRIMGPAFDGMSSSTYRSEKSERSFIAKSESPVDIAPPVSVMLAPPRSFPPPRNFEPTTRPSMETLSFGHHRQASSISISGDSTRRLLPPPQARLKHAHSGSSLNGMSTINANAIARPITPVSQLNEMLDAPAPAQKEGALLRLDLDVLVAPEHGHSLPAPPREGRSPVVRRPTVTSGNSPTDSSALIAVPLKTPMSAESSYASQRNSFINMYGTRSAARTGSSTNGEHPQMSSFSFVGSPGYTSGEDSDVPRSAFGSQHKISLPSGPRLRPKPKSLRSELRDRLSMVESPEESVGLSSIAWASLVATAATSNGGVRSETPASNVKTMRRRSKSVDSLIIPSTLRPRTPASARMPIPSGPQDTQVIPLPKSATNQAPKSSRVARWDSRAMLHEGPSRTPKYAASSEQA